MNDHLQETFFPTDEVTGICKESRTLMSFANPFYHKKLIINFPWFSRFGKTNILRRSLSPAIWVEFWGWHWEYQVSYHPWRSSQFQHGTHPAGFALPDGGQGGMRFRSQRNLQDLSSRNFVQEASEKSAAPATNAVSCSCEILLNPGSDGPIPEWEFHQLGGKEMGDVIFTNFTGYLD